MLLAIVSISCLSSFEFEKISAGLTITVCRMTTAKIPSTASSSSLGNCATAVFGSIE